MYSAKVLEHFKNPRNVGELADATAVVEVSNPACGDVIVLSIKVDGQQITAASFQARGCVASIACGSILMEMLGGKTVEQARAIQPNTIAEALGGLQPTSVHGSHLAHDALEAVLAKIKQS